jgi:hypothetical protein
MPPQAQTQAVLPPNNYLVLNLAILHASHDPREAPWYGPWNIVLQDLFRDFCRANSSFFTATYPQFPLTKDIDLRVVVDSDEEESDKGRAGHRQAGLYPLSPIKYTC